MGLWSLSKISNVYGSKIKEYALILLNENNYFANTFIEIYRMVTEN